MKVLVTGGAGFIGSNLCRRLIDEPTVGEVRVMDDFSTGFRDNLDGLPVDLREGSILNEELLADAVRGCDAVVHLAALGSVPRSVGDPLHSHEVNATGTLKVLLAARESDAHVVLSSSSSVYGANPGVPKSEEMQCLPMSPYAVSKLATEQYAMAFAECYSLAVLPFRFFNVYGPRQRAGHAYAAVIPAFLDAALHGRPIPLNGDGRQSRDFTFVGTVCELLAAAIVARTTSTPTNLAFGSRTNLRELIAMIASALGTDLVVEERPARPGDVAHSQADNSQLQRLFPATAPVSLEDGLQETVAWMRSLPEVSESSSGPTNH